MAGFGIVLLCSCWAVFSLTAAESCVEGGVAVACNPPVQRNIAVGIAPVASNTCGQDGPERVCYRAGSGAGYAGQCTVCDAGDHPAALATDPHTEESLTYWQSQTYRSVQHPNTVTLTISLNKTYSVNSVSVLFQSARPESFSLSLSNDNGGSFTPLHYFSRSCNSTYGVAETTPGSPQQSDAAGALCSSDGAQLVPLSGGRSVYSVASYGQDSVLATDLRLELDRLNTFGDEGSWDTEVLDSYYYAITDIAISGRCHCNGHAGSCVRVVGGGLECNCTHNTAGEDCQRCLPSHNDRPWSPAVEGDARECVGKQPQSPRFLLYLYLSLAQNVIAMVTLHGATLTWPSILLLETCRVVFVTTASTTHLADNVSDVRKGSIPTQVYLSLAHLRALVRID